MNKAYWIFPKLIFHKVWQKAEFCEFQKWGYLRLSGHRRYNFMSKFTDTFTYFGVKHKMSSFKSNENICKKEDGSYYMYVVSANKASSVTL